MKAIFTRDHDRYSGVRPINVWLLRLLYLCMAVFVGIENWATILAHQGTWDPVRAVAFCVWATYPTLSLLGVIHPLKMLPIVIFMIGYKLLWLAVVAYPLWRAGTLAGSPAEGMARIFLGTWVPLLIVPWGYVWDTYVVWGPGRAAAHGQAATSGRRAPP